MEELDVEAVEGCDRELGDAVLLLEAQHELVAGVGDLVELVEPERQGGGLLAFGEQQPALDVVGAAELVSLVDA